MSGAEKTIAGVVARKPEWLRRDLLSDDRSLRSPAEEALAAMIAAALAKSAAE